MQLLKSLCFVGVGALSMAGLASVWAQDVERLMPPPKVTNVDMVDGEIRKIDLSASKVTIKHGEIKKLDMPPMTMVFMVKDKSLLEKIKVGDQVRFSVIDEGGKMVITMIQVK